MSDHVDIKRCLRAIGRAEPTPAIRARIGRRALARLAERPGRGLPFRSGRAAAPRGGRAAAALRPLLLLAPLSACALALALMGRMAAPGEPAARAAERPADRGRSLTSPQALDAHWVTPGPGAELAIAEWSPLGAELALQAGTARLVVVPRTPWQQLTVHTPELVAQASRANVQVSSALGCTRVEVSEGCVTVRTASELRLLAAGATAELCSGMLEERESAQEALIQRALAALAAGDHAAGARLLEAYRRDYPQGQFGEEALYHLAVARATLGEEPSATELARSLIARFPHTERARRLQRWLEAR